MTKIVKPTGLLIFTLLWSMGLSAHEGLHVIGQVHMGEYHIGFIEVSLLVAALIIICGVSLKRPNKGDTKGPH